MCFNKDLLRKETVSLSPSTPPWLPLGSRWAWAGLCGAEMWLLLRYTYIYKQKDKKAEAARLKAISFLLTL